MSESGCSEQLWFKLIAIAIGAFTLGFAIANAVFYGRIGARGGCGSVLSSTSAWIMMWINIVLAIFGLILLLFGLWRLILSRERRQKIQDTTSEKIQSGLSSTKTAEDVARERTAARPTISSTTASRDDFSPQEEQLIAAIQEQM